MTQAGVYSLVRPPCRRASRASRATRCSISPTGAGGSTSRSAGAQRLGLAREPHWDEVRRHLAPLPIVDGVFVHSAEWHDTYTKRAWEHPDPVGVLGMLPPLEGVDRGDRASHRTARSGKRGTGIARWGWDFPWMAMAAARVGEPRIAVEALLKDSDTRNIRRCAA